MVLWQDFERVLMEEDKGYNQGSWGGNVELAKHPFLDAIRNYLWSGAKNMTGEEASDFLFDNPKIEVDIIKDQSGQEPDSWTKEWLVWFLKRNR